MPTVTCLLRDHVTLTCECIDRIYLNGYVPLLQTPRQLARFYSDHRGHPVVSPVLCQQHTTNLVQAVETFAAHHHIPIIHFPKRARKEEIARKHFARYHAPEGVVLIGVAQERMRGFRATKIASGQFRWTRQSICVKHYYFYLLDRYFGPAFIKLGTYLPFPIRVWLNGHEWVKRQLTQAGIPYQALDNGILSVADPQRCQALCDEFSTEHVDAFFRKWLRRLPHPFTAADRAAGYRYQLSVIQLEVSGAERFAVLEVLLEFGMLVENVQAGSDLAGDQLGPEGAMGRPGDLAAKHELDVLGARQVEVLADDLLEELPAVEGLLKHMGSVVIL